MRKPKLSVVIPTHQEKGDSCLLDIATQYPYKIEEIEYLVIDHGTSQEILNLLSRDDFQVISVAPCTRASKLQQGYHKCRGEWVLFHHPRSLILPGGVETLLKKIGSAPRWGGFTHQFDQNHLGLRWTSFYSNHIRPRYSSILYLDHCLYFHRQLLDRPIPDIPIFEDSEISKILRAHSRPHLLNHGVKTSAIRFNKKGFWHQAVLNQYLKIRYLMGSSFDEMNKLYEDKLNLNG